MLHTRRRFLETAWKGCTLVSLGSTVPLFLKRSALATLQSRRAGDRVLVVVQLSGGNDGLNTVIPYGDELYAKNRQLLRIPSSQVLKVDGSLGLHPSLEGLSKLLEDGHLAIVQGIGYPNPSRSHFRSMDIWQTARLAEKLPGEGWLGRAIARLKFGHEGTLPAVHFGSGKLPLALVGRAIAVPSLSGLADYRLRADASSRKLLEDLASVQRSDDTLQFLQRASLQAYTSSSRLEELARKYDTPVRYPDTGLARKLKLIAQLIDSGFGTRIFYVSLGGFDTHANQPAVHANLLRELGGAVQAFMEDLGGHGQRDRVLLMTFSEFGRRVKENGSHGTDHGAGAPMFLAGGRVSNGVIGKHPSLSDLDRGDLKFHTDFRRVYATILEEWLGCPSREVLGGQFERLAVLV